MGINDVKKFEETCKKAKKLGNYAVSTDNIPLMYGKCSVKKTEHPLRNCNNLQNLKNEL